MNIDVPIQLQMARDRFIDGQVECALSRHLDSLAPDTPMADIVDSYRVWESHRDVKTETWMSVGRRRAKAVCQVSADERMTPVLPQTETLEGMIRRLLSTSAAPPPQVNPIPLDRDLLIR